MLAVIALASSPAAGQGLAPPDSVAAFIRERLHVSHYRRANADLDGDGRPEIFVYADDAQHCGSGGCSLFVLSPRGRGYRVVLRASVVRPPIRLLATTTRGWRDIGVTVGGGGIVQPYVARLRFDGRLYPGNPTVPPAVALKRASGRVLIGS